MNFFRRRKRWILWIAAGLLLRLLLIAVPGPADDDTGVYLELGHNLLHHGTYGIADGDDLSPSLFRLPGYPLFLATAEQAFARFWPDNWMNAVYILQALADLTAGLLLALFARRHLSDRAAEIALALAMLCPFTAAFARIGMTECLSVFAISLGIYAAGRALAAAEAGGQDFWALVLAGFASALAMLLRPDGALLPAALGAGILLYPSLSSTAASRNSTRWSQMCRATLGAALFSLIALAPLAPWAVRNWQTFHVFQPLAPRYVNDPGEPVNLGFYRWMRTWSVEYISTCNVFWHVGTEKIDLNDLPARAFDSPQQKEQTRQLFDDYNRWNAISPELDSRFAALAAARIHSAPLHYYVVLPVLRVADMTLRPRTYEFELAADWWNWSAHPAESALEIFLGLINLGYFALAAWGFFRRRVSWAAMLGGYILMRCLLLATVENSEPRYTMQLFPILILATAAALAPKDKAAIQQAGTYNANR
jgi:4-amino-4-deoxy-L-arabinose transferase-like glycosyltransferase